MTKQEYLLYFKAHNWSELIYEYHLEVGKVKKSKQEIINIVNHWNRLEINTGGIFNEPYFDLNKFISHIVKYFGNKFEILKIYNKENQIIKTI